MNSGNIFERIVILTILILMSLVVTVSALGSMDILYDEWQDDHSFVQYGEDFEVFYSLNHKSGSAEVFYSTKPGYFEDVQEFKEFFSGFVEGSLEAEFPYSISAIYASAISGDKKEIWNAEWKPNKKIKYTEGKL